MTALTSQARESVLKSIENRNRLYSITEGRSVGFLHSVRRVLILRSDLWIDFSLKTHKKNPGTAVVSFLSFFFNEDPAPEAA